MKMDAEKYLNTYLEDLRIVIEKLDVDKVIQIYYKLNEVRNQNGKIFVFGNGGSAATASHAICDLSKNTRTPKNKRLKVIGLNDNMATFSAYANDEGYENSLKEQIISLGDRGDLAIAISGSGNSINVIRAVEAAKEKGVFTVGITAFQGGKLKNVADLTIVVPSNDMEIAEDIHLVIIHMLTGLLRGNRYDCISMENPI